MRKAHAIRAVFFLAGGGVMAAILWLTSGVEDPGAAKFAAGAKAAPSLIPAEMSPATAVAETKSPPPPSTRAQKLFDATLPILRACEGQERTARAMLLISELRRAGPDGIVVLGAFLATEEDLAFGPRFKIDGANVLGQKSLRAAILNELGASKDSAARQVYRDETLNSLRKAETLADAEGLIRSLQAWEPGAHRAEAVKAIKRLVQTDTGGGTANNAAMVAQVVALFGAEELLPDLEAVALKDPKSGLPELFGALWSIPAELRKETTERILADESLRAAMKSGYPLHKLDDCIPMARDVALEWFGSSAAVTAKAEAVERLASLQGWGPNYSLNPAGVNPDSAIAAPGKPTQARARLELLEQVAPLCPEPLVQQKLAAARKELARQTLSSSK